MKHPLVPEGWDIDIEGDTLRICSPAGGPGYVTLCAYERTHVGRLLYALAIDLTTNPFPSVGHGCRALTQFIDGLLASLGREPTEAELRAAAHSLTVRADRIAMARPAYRGA